MTTYELLRLLTMPIMPTLIWQTWISLRKLSKKIDSRSQKEMLVLDVGGRKSPYTIGLKAKIHISEIEQVSDTQKKLNLGMNAIMLEFIQKKRSNIEKVIIDDMTQTKLPNSTYDSVVCIEVIEHVQEDDAFIRNVDKILKQGGWLYLTTPNGDYIKNEPPHFNPDHIRHYTKDQLLVLLGKYFSEVQIHYSVKTGKYRRWGLKSYSTKSPISTTKSIIGNIVNKFENIGRKDKPYRSAHLVALCKKGL